MLFKKICAYFIFCMNLSQLYVSTIHATNLDDASISKYSLDENEKPTELLIDEIEEPKCQRGLGQASLFSSGANLLKTFIGAGIISLPFAVYEFGYLTGILLTTVAACASCMGLYFFLRVATLFGRESNPFLAAQITIPWLGYVLDSVICMKSFGVSLSYVLLIGDIMSSFVKGSLEVENSSPDLKDLTDPRLWICCFMVIIIPLSFLRKMDHLKYSSLLGLVAVVYLLVLAGVTFFVELPSIDFNQASPVREWTFKRLSRFGIFMLAFTCHQNIFPIHNETKDNSVKSLTILCIICISIAYLIYVTYGLFSYFAFIDAFFLNSSSGGSMFKYYSGTEVPYQVARILFAFLLAFSYPLQVFPFRLSFGRLLSELPCMKERQMNVDVFYVVVTTCFLACTFGIAMLKPNISNILSLVGAMTSTVICYILPSIIFLKLTTKGPQFFTKENVSVIRVVAGLLLLFGSVVFCICTSASIANFFT